MPLLIIIHGLLHRFYTGEEIIADRRNTTGITSPTEQDETGEYKGEGSCAHKFWPCRLTAS